MPTTVKKKSETTITVSKKSAAQLNGHSIRRQSKNRFIGATEAETDQKVAAYNRFLDTLSDEEMDIELRKLSSGELHLLAWITTYYEHQKRRKEAKKGTKKGSQK